MDKRIGYTEDFGELDIVVPPELISEFKVMVKRAMSTWQDVSSEMRDFADRVAGVDNYVGQNMKAGHSEQEKKFVVPIKNNFLSSHGLPIGNTCQGHPETCNCDYHCR